MKKQGTTDRTRQRIRRFLWNSSFVFALLFADIAGRQQVGIVLAAEAADTVQKDQASEETKDADGAAAQEAKDTAV